MNTQLAFLSGLLSSTLLACPPTAPCAAPPVPQASSNIPYLTDGIGEEAQTALAAVRKEYNLRLTFAYARSGAWLADVGVSIRNAQGTVLAVTTEGPFLLARLPAGRYTISASFAGQQLSKTLTLRPQRASERVFYFTEK